MPRRYSVDPSTVRETFERRLGRTLSETEFEQILRSGDGLFWDYLPQRGFLQYYDQATLRSTARTLNHANSR
jgi:hypothetical protein